MFPRNTGQPAWRRNAEDTIFMYKSDLKTHTSHMQYLLFFILLKLMLIYLFVVYLTMISVAQPVWRQKLGLLVNPELKRI
jgi:hypothetical protein